MTIMPKPNEISSAPGVSSPTRLCCTFLVAGRDKHGGNHSSVSYDNSNNGDNGWSDVDNDNRAPWLLWSASKVCRRWRDVVLHSPEVWRALTAQVD